MRQVVFGIMGCWAMLGLAAMGSADEWPQYRGLMGTGKSAESIPDRYQLREVWKVPTSLGFSSFSVADGRAFTMVTDEAGEHETCLALHAETGDTLWSQPLGSVEYGHDGGNAGAPGNRGGDGPRSTPSTDGERVYVYDSDMTLYCFRGSDGTMIWRRSITEDFDGRQIKWKNATSPVLDGDHVYVAGGGAGQSFLAFNKVTGKVIWKQGDETMTHATPHLTTIGGRRQLVFFMQSGLVAVAPDSGKELWRQKFRFSISTAASPVSVGTRIYCSAGYGVGAGLFEVPNLADDSTPTDPTKVWIKPNKLMNHWSTPLEHQGHLFGIFEFKKYGKAPLQCVDLANGEIRWSQRGFGPGNCIQVGDKLVVLSDSGEVVIVRAATTGYQELSRKAVLQGKCWSTPAFSDGHIFVRSTEEAVCLAVEEI